MTELSTQKAAEGATTAAQDQMAPERQGRLRLYRSASTSETEDRLFVPLSFKMLYCIFDAENGTEDKS
ncbi:MULTISPECIES: hypothetical protein [Rhizobium]|uniref:hypothetical protein n=1 Tax=Rhizobium TaxID=379 RepID=UPI0010394B5E|nr:MULTISPECIES: hypothetical protein [Rhizobium]MBY3170714.1 hypothetical protein [Rhizobium laguerreae]MBY5622983.1 hypothetical protein [Rhizobium leguminosarum]TBZ10368.1 hypothetical protein E0H38_25590 [Rhizobium leguminosarum bv. viciae]